MTGEAGIRGSGDGLGESACPEPEDEAVYRCHETSSNNDDGTTGSLRVGMWVSEPVNGAT